MRRGVDGFYYHGGTRFCIYLGYISSSTESGTRYGREGGVNQVIQIKLLYLCKLYLSFRVKGRQGVAFPVVILFPQNEVVM